MSLTKIVTTPIYYVNASERFWKDLADNKDLIVIVEPHVGHLYSTVLADTIHRHFQFLGHQSLLTSGTDEHGQKIAIAATKASMTPAEYCDSMSSQFESLFAKSHISPSSFVFTRTSSPEHIKNVQTIWNQLLDKGYIYKGVYEGWYSVSDESFIPESQTKSVIDPTTGVESKVTLDSGTPVEWIKEENYKFKLSAFQPRILEWLKTLNAQGQTVVQPTERALDLVKRLDEEPLADLSVSRPISRVTWGIPVPQDNSQVIYVWLDALFNYWTASKGVGQSVWPPEIHVIGKDIIKFHALYWPAFLLALDFKLPKTLLVHGHWLIDNKKMSKSLGIVIDPELLMRRYGVDVIRYFLIADGKLGRDCEFSFRSVERRHQELLAILGNLVLRLSGKRVNPKQVVPSGPTRDYNPEERALIQKLNDLSDLYIEKSSNFDFSSILESIVLVLHDVNKAFGKAIPWKLSPDEQRHILHVCYESLRISALLLSPVIPQVSDTILTTLGVPENMRKHRDAIFGSLERSSDFSISKPKALFSKL